MSILRTLLDQAAGILGIHETEVDKWRVQKSEESGKEDLQYIRERQLESSTKSSTPLSHQIIRSEQVLSDLKSRLIPLAKDILPHLFAFEMQKERVDQLHAERALEQSKALGGSGSNLHPDYNTHCKALHRLGAGPTQVRQLAQHDIVIIADLARWKGQDPRYEDPANPWIAVREIYANRTMQRHSSGGKAYHKSQPGAPPQHRHDAMFDGYWRFKK